MIVREVGAPTDASGWDEFVEAHPDGTLFHTDAWREVVARHFPYRPRYLEAVEGGVRVGVLPLFEARTVFHPRALLSVPYGVYGGPLAASVEAEAALVAHARDMLDREGLAFVELRSTRPGSVPLVEVNRHVAFTFDPPGDPSQCLSGLRRGARAVVRKAVERHGLELVEDRALIRHFNSMFAAEKRRLGAASPSTGYFEALAADARLGVRLHGVRGPSGALLSVMLSFTHGRTLMPYYSGSVPRAREVGAASFVYWKLMCLAVDEGLDGIDFGRSRIGTGAYAFKRNLGLREVPLHYRYVLPDGGEGTAPASPPYRVPKGLMRRLPPPVGRAIGPFVVRMTP